MSEWLKLSLTTGLPAWVKKSDVTAVKQEDSHAKVFFNLHGQYFEVTEKAFDIMNRVFTERLN
ncbi:hypothetical protein [Paenibacillus cremeus]|uniref:Uncharacterized protein n=1 Tax=Paenibacillus cremeus TaxID=2163881 RepID=A0A559K7V2_9BACL|nr:hypothetical protein [Paenibacillus cremeus]TVY08163.1 hypothetical protein FPZ49_19865 [Paenibacillus cremeus]